MPFINEWTYQAPPPPQGQDYCYGCDGLGNTGHEEDPPYGEYTCYICGGRGYVTIAEAEAHRKRAAQDQAEIDGEARYFDRIERRDEIMGFHDDPPDAGDPYDSFGPDNEEPS